MRVFLTGATGFIGSALIPELIHAGHTVLGLTRSEDGAQAVQAAGAEVHRGNIEDLDSLRSGAAQADAVIHCAFNHDFSKFVANCENDRLAIEAIGSVLAGSERPFLITSGTGMGNSAPGQLASEDILNVEHPNPRTASEVAGQALVERGVNVSVIRLPQVHDTRKQGLVTYSIAIAREKGVSAYVGDGLNRWPAAHRLDVVRLYVLALEKATRGARYNAVAEEGVTARSVAEAVARGLGIPAVSLAPAQAAEHFGWMAMFAGLDMPASSALTRQRLSWQPTGPDLITDLNNMHWQ